MTLTTILVACIGSSGLASIIVALLNHYWARKDKKDDRLDAVVSGLKVLTVRYLGRGYISDHEISLEDKENLEEMYRAYKALGGNGHLKTVMDEVERLPVAENEARS